MYKTKTNGGEKSDATGAELNPHYERPGDP